MNYTDIDKSRRLLEAGISPETADMWWNVRGPVAESLMYNEFPSFEKVTGRDVPCWSLDALLHLLKPVNGNTYRIDGTLDGGAVIRFDEVTNVMYHESEIIDSVYEMVLWLRNKKVI